jgi:outer membrane protein
VAKAQSGQDLTPDERSAFAQLSQTLEAVQVRYQNDIAAAAQPAILAADQAIRVISEANGYTIVFDGAVAQQTGLVVYATSGLDITQQVVDYINQSQ